MGSIGSMPTRPGSSPRSANVSSKRPRRLPLGQYRIPQPKRPPPELQNAGTESFFRHGKKVVPISRHPASGTSTPLVLIHSREAGLLLVLEGVLASRPGVGARSEDEETESALAAASSSSNPFLSGRSTNVSTMRPRRLPLGRYRTPHPKRPPPAFQNAGTESFFRHGKNVVLV